ncbi:hypothetical protein [Marinobacterium ramblicola]|uniref:hypothetical protein n=1 Tax=Marinobacterium ramblicola TaxID=2849041 RepID=UPI001C2D7D99|nr:hypothetical protein [Marinobacterium ramblicola]
MRYMKLMGYFSLVFIYFGFLFRFYLGCVVESKIDLVAEFSLFCALKRRVEAPGVSAREVLTRTLLPVVGLTRP